MEPSNTAIWIPSSAAEEVGFSIRCEGFHDVLHLVAALERASITFLADGEKVKGGPGVRLK